MKTFKFIYLLLLAVLFAGCKKFLDLPPKNQRAVESLQDVKSVLAGYLDGVKTKDIKPIVGAFPLFTEQQVMMFEAYSDNIDFQNGLPHYLSTQNIHAKEIFYADMLLWNQYDAPTAIWTKYYEAVGFLNALIDQTATLTDGTPDERDRVMGEMLVHRAFYFFKLLQYFAPYNKADLGIPVYLHSGDEVVGVAMPRKPQAEVYKVITDDLKQALALAERSAPRSNFNVFYNARYINNLLAQVYWFKAESAAKESTDYTNAKQYSTAAVNGVETMIPATTADINLAAQGKMLTYPAFYQTGNTYSGISAIYGSTWDYLGFEPKGIPVAADLLSLFSGNDIRKAAYFNGNNLSSAWPDGVGSGPKYVHFYLFQPEEAYLVLAEAQYRLGETGDCITTLNKFKSFRNAGDANGLSGNQLLQEIVNERRKEFFTAGDKRWLDLKRYGGVTISRTLRFFNKNYQVSAAPNDYHYALPIPLTEIQQNPHIIPNEGWVPIVY